MNNLLNELMLKDINDLTEKQKEFLEIHNNIFSSGVLINNGLIELAKNLKIMKDEKLYLEIGFDTFEIYCEEACGIKRSQAYKYIKVLDTLGENFLHSSGQIGISKLALLSSLTTDEREIIQAEVNISDVSVSELKDKIKKVEIERDKFKSSVIKKNTEIRELNKQINDLKDKVEVTIEKNIVENPEQVKKIESLEQLVKVQEQKLFEYDSKLLIASSTELTEFGLLFTQVQEIIIKMKNLINYIPEESRNKCIDALKKVGEQLC